MDERSDMEKLDEVMLPGFRFHPTDEELVAFYLKRKIRQERLSIELIRQLDIYKYDPWELPKLAATGEKEWYFYCPRDRKYRNSSRPNRVTGAGFWKATGTDRPIYSSEGTKCIGLKKSLVFYKGRAAKGIKTDWMMHEFRLPSLSDPSLPKRPIDKNITANDAWAICRIFKKTNSMAQRALSHSWVSSVQGTTDSGMLSVSNTIHCAQFGSSNISSNTSCTTEAGSSIQFGCNNVLPQQPSSTSYPPMDINSYKSVNLTNSKSTAEIPAGFMFSPVDMPVPSKCTVDVASMLQILSPAILGDVEKASASIDFGQQQQSNSFSMGMNGTLAGIGGEEMSMRRNTNASQTSNNQRGTLRTVNFPFSLTSNFSDAWRPNFPWDSPPCPSEMSTSHSTNKCYT